MIEESTSRYDTQAQRVIEGDLSSYGSDDDKVRKLAQNSLAARDDVTTSPQECLSNIIDNREIDPKNFRPIHLPDDLYDNFCPPRIERNVWTEGCDVVYPNVFNSPKIQRFFHDNIAWVNNLTEENWETICNQVSRCVVPSYHSDEGFFSDYDKTRTLLLGFLNGQLWQDRSNR